MVAAISKRSAFGAVAKAQGIQRRASRRSSARSAERLPPPCVRERIQHLDPGERRDCARFHRGLARFVATPVIWPPLPLAKLAPLIRIAVAALRCGRGGRLHEINRQKPTCRHCVTKRNLVRLQVRTI